ncbi:MAG TPA: dihydrofolate reductase family protein [Acidimicrobiales bacterium]
MGSLAVVEFITLDGVMQGFGSPDEDREGGFEHGGWGVAYADEGQFEAAVESLPSTSAYLFGRRTYEKMSQFWPHQPDDNPMAAHLNASPKYVATRTLTEVPWHNSRVLEGPLGTRIAELKAAHDGSIVVLGSGALVEQLSALDLVDEYTLYLHPLLLGTGKRLFRSLERPHRLRLVEASPTSTGVVTLQYARDRSSTWPK